MEELKRRVKELVPEDKKSEVDILFGDWMATLKVYTIPSGVSREESDSNTDKELSNWKTQVEEFNAQFERFKNKMKLYTSLPPSTTNLLIANDTKNELNKIRKEVAKIRSQIEKDKKENLQIVGLMVKLDEMKKFLEKLK
ncbi:hypothetical protein RUM44_013899 [Polyplax serrata]|uniref:Uncharacterized protein n=1 Tax=Polyplax serrata TaxID=468196 RepID=A0ABR1BFG7_POLSC